MADNFLTRYGLNRKAGARTIYKLRKLYMDTVVPTDTYSNFFDGSVRQFYGKVDFKGNIIYPSEKFLKPLDRNGNSSYKQAFALNFVADAFHDLQRHVAQASQLGVLNSNKELSNIIPAKGWESVHIRYGQNVEALYDALVNSYMEKPSEFRGASNTRPVNFAQFMKLTEELFLARGKNLKLTRSSYILSNFCPISISGMSIEIAPGMDYGNDSKKNMTYMENPNFSFYMNSLKKFGFMADINYPGRVIADIGSQPMQTYMKRYGVTFEDIFDKHFYKASNYDYDLVKIYLSQFYNNYVAQIPAKIVSKGGGYGQANRYSIQANSAEMPNNTIDIGSLFGGESGDSMTKRRFSSTELVRRETLTTNEMMKKYDDPYWLGVYARVANFELDCPLADADIKKIIKNAINLKSSIDISTAASYIDEKIRQFRFPLDSYNIFITEIESVESCR